jgi:hypothetical protein
MERFIGCDAHQKYSVFVVMDERGRASEPVLGEDGKREAGILEFRTCRTELERLRLWQSASKVKHVAMESIRGSPARR